MAKVRISPNERRFEFGKYVGLSVMEVIEKDPQYIEYMSRKITWLFTDHEKQVVRNLRSRQSNRDIHMVHAKCRSNFEDEMYSIFHKICQAYD